jgi:hypothetical protein
MRPVVFSEDALIEQPVIRLFKDVLGDRPRVGGRVRVFVVNSWMGYVTAASLCQTRGLQLPTQAGGKIDVSKFSGNF